MSKPILIVKFPRSYPIDIAEKIASNLQLNLQLANDYHVFTIPNSVEDFDFKIFNGDYTEDDYRCIENFIEDIKNNK